ncbi:TonB-dependent receptor domain-containing protein [Haemophilus haemolyticus]|uniref:TonB-dependent receptor domain-containing protein n=1 Tax=Haemophilus haemolyticus TaxID=726 RepID=UPI0019560B85|nr:TonB-dependent receptor [Haemophilus haemolyticus]VTX60343.1 Colicin I receptor [Haemophilus haemolyticus]
MKSITMKLSPLNLTILTFLTTAAIASEQKTEILAPIVVTASGSSQEFRDAPASISVINQEQLKKRPSYRLENALQDIPGVNLSGSNANRTDISIRGLPADYTLIMVDGHRQNTRESRPNGNGGFEGGFIPPVNAIERIEIVRGPMSSLYGSDAMGGVVNIITKNATSKWIGSISTGFTAHDKSDFGNGYQGNFFVSGPIMKDILGIQIYGGGNYRQEDNLIGASNKNKDQNLNTKITFTPVNKQTFILEGGRHSLEKDETPGKTIDLTTTRGTSITKNNPTSTHATRSHWSLTHQADWEFITSELSFLQEIAKREVSTNNVTNSRKPEIKNNVFDAKFMLPLSNHFFVFGGQVQQSKLQDDSVTQVKIKSLPNGKKSSRAVFEGSKNSIKQSAIFLEDRIDLSKDFLLTLGSRLDHHEKYGSYWSPRAYMVYHINDNFSIKGGLGKAFKAPSIREISESYVTSTEAGAGVIYGNKNLKPETSLNEEVALLYSNENGYNAGITLFNTDFKNKLTSYYSGLQDTATGAKLYKYANVGRANIKGIEISSHIPFNSYWNADLTYTYQDSKRQSDEDISASKISLRGLPLDNTPKHSASAKLNWEINDSFSAYTRVAYKGKQIWANPRNGDNKHQYRTRGAYTTIDLGSTYKFNPNVSLSIAILNIGNEIGERVNTNGGSWTVEDGRRLWTNLNVTF